MASKVWAVYSLGDVIFGHGKAGRGKAWRGGAWRGKARQGKQHGAVKRPTVLT